MMFRRSGSRRAFIERGQVPGHVRALDQRPEPASGRRRPSGFIGTGRPARSRTRRFGPGDVSIKWFEDGILNAAYNCIDRHLPTRAKQTAIIWEGDDPAQSKHISYRELHDEVCKFANILRNRNVEEGRSRYHLPAHDPGGGPTRCSRCARRIGAIHSVVFGGFSPDSLAGRIEDCGSKVVITADEGIRGGRKISAQGQYRCPRSPRSATSIMSSWVRRNRRGDQHGSGARRLLRQGRRGW